MRCNDIAYLCTAEIVKDEVGNEDEVLTKKQVFANAKSVGYREFYAAATADIKPDMILELSDYLDYSQEKTVEFKGQLYDVIRAYQKGMRMELTLTTRLGDD